MKTLKQKLTIPGITLLCMFVFAGADGLFAQNDTAKTFKFLIVAETKNDEIKLTCKEGCTWKKLTFSLPLNQSQSIDQNGMIPAKKESKDDNLSKFYFTVTRTEEGLKLHGSKGTAWENLSFSCKEGKCVQSINQNGMIK